MNFLRNHSKWTVGALAASVALAATTSFLHAAL